MSSWNIKNLARFKGLVRKGSAVMLGYAVPILFVVQVLPVTTFWNIFVVIMVVGITALLGFISFFASWLKIERRVLAAVASIGITLVAILYGLNQSFSQPGIITYVIDGSELKNPFNPLKFFSRSVEVSPKARLLLLNHPWHIDAARSQAESNPEDHSLGKTILPRSNGDSPAAS